MKFSKKNNFADIYYAEEADPDEIANRIAHKKHVGVLDWGDPENMIFVMVGDGRDPEVAKRMNRIKGRAENQVIAIAGFDDLVEKLGELEKAKILHKGKITPREVMKKLFEHPIGVIVPAKEDLPEWVTTNEGGQKKVMIAGQSHNHSHDYVDLFNLVVRKLADKYNTFCAGTSANRRDQEVFTIHQQNEAYEELKKDIDFFVMRKNVQQKHSKKLITSCTALQLDGEKAIVKRWGSRDIKHFKKHLHDLRVPYNVNILPGAEITLTSMFGRNLHPFLRLRLFTKLLKKLIKKVTNGNFKYILTSV